MTQDCPTPSSSRAKPSLFSRLQDILLSASDDRMVVRRGFKPRHLNRILRHCHWGIVQSMDLEAQLKVVKTNRKIMRMNLRGVHF